jgi:hypothetical protein
MTAERVVAHFVNDPAAFEAAREEIASTKHLEWWRGLVAYWVFGAIGAVISTVLRVTAIYWILPLVGGFGIYVVVVSIRDKIKYRKEPKIQSLNLK